MRSHLTTHAVTRTGAVVAGAVSCAVRWQTQSRFFTRPSATAAAAPLGNAARDGRSSGFGAAPLPSSGDARRGALGKSVVHLNRTGDGELTIGTRKAMCDDGLIVGEIFKHIPPNGAISIKSLFSSLHEDIQEAIGEQHGGLREFLELRQQMFVLRPRPEDGVLYVAGNAIVAQQYANRDAQRQTMRDMLGLMEDTGNGGQRGRYTGNGGSRGRGGGYGRGGGGDRGRSFSGARDGRRGYGGRSNGTQEPCGDRSPGGRGGQGERPPRVGTRMGVNQRQYGSRGGGMA